MGLRQKTWKREVCEFAIVRLRWLIHMNESTREYDPYYIARYTARNGDIYEGEYKVTGLLSFKTSTIDFESCRRGSGTASVFIHSVTATRHSHQSVARALRCSSQVVDSTDSGCSRCSTMAFGRKARKTEKLVLRHSSDLFYAMSLGFLAL